MWATLLESSRHGVVLTISDSLVSGLSIFIERIRSLLDCLNGTTISVHFQGFGLLCVDSAGDVRKSSGLLIESGIVRFSVVKGVWYVCRGINEF